jgi:hypothetical protein
VVFGAAEPLALHQQEPHQHQATDPHQRHTDLQLAEPVLDLVLQDLAHLAQVISQAVQALIAEVLDLVHQALQEVLQALVVPQEVLTVHLQEVLHEDNIT